MVRRPPVLVAIAAAGLLASSCGPKTMQVRMERGEKQARQAEERLDEADKQLTELDPDAAEKSLGRAREALAGPDIRYYPEETLLKQRLEQTEAKLPGVRAEVARLDLERKVKKQRKRVEEASEALKKALVEADKRDISRGRAKDARSAHDELKEALADGLEVEKKDAPYEAFSVAQKKALEQAAPKVAIAELRAAFVDGPGEAKAEASRLAAKANKEKKADARRKIIAEVLEKLRVCADQGTAQLAKAPALAVAAVVVEGAATTPKAVVAACAKTYKALAPKAAATKAPPPPKKARR